MSSHTASGSGSWAASAEFAALSVVFAVGAKLLYSAFNVPPKSAAPSYIPFSNEYTPDKMEQVVVTDCTHPSLPTLSHHKGHRNPAGLRPSDTSTGLVLNAIAKRAQWSTKVYALTQRSFITANHFDVDAFLACWVFMNRQQALAHEGVLRHMARIGDFREAFLSPDLITQYGHDDGITFIREAYTALKLCCWINTLERRLFSAPYETKDCTPKMEFFLKRFGRVIEDPEAVWGDWQAEYTQVVSGFDQLSGGDCMVETVPSVGLVAISAPEPLHYYSLFSHSTGYDHVLMMYDGNRYELECKYTQFVMLASRPVWPRLDMAALASVLNQIEGGALDEEGLRWTANRFTDSGPLLRLEREHERLTKAQRYGHPTERPIYSSSILPSKMLAIVQSFFEFGLAGVAPKRGGWEWQELHALNERLRWAEWATRVLAQHEHGELDLSEWARERAMRRRSSNANGAALSPTALSPPPGPGAFAQAMAVRGPRALSPLGAGAAAGMPLPVGGDVPGMSAASALLAPKDVAAISGTLPPMYRQHNWTLLYSTARDGISLHTLLRKAAGASPCVLVAKDTHGAVFGAFTTEPWRIAPRFYGTGESFVFQVEPQHVMYPWLQQPNLRNDFFQFASHDGIGVGGSGHWAISLDTDLLRGSSGSCDTFGSPCLASAEEFEVAAVELWHISSR